MSGIIGQRGVGQRSGVVGPAASNQPAFLVYKTGTQASPANGATITWDAERFDQGGNFASNTFTAPVTAKYHFSWSVRVAGLASDCAAMYPTLVTTPATYSSIQITPVNEMDSGGLDVYGFVGSLLVDMDANDTAYLTIVFAGTAPTNIHADTHFSGFLAC